MKSIFFKLYSGLICILLLAALLGYLALQLVNQIRYENYLVNNVGGTFSLMAAGIVRHDGDKQQQWIEIVERLTGIPLEVGPLKEPERFTLYHLKKDNQALLIASDPGQQTASIALPLPGNSQHFVQAKLEDINQTVTRMTALLILNELGRHPKQQREAILKQLDQNFSYDLTLVTAKETELDQSQLRQLARGDIVINLNDTLSSNPFIKVYARFGNSGLYLTVGPINIFQWYPVSIIFLLVISGALLVLAAGYILIAPFEKKLKRLEQGINLAGTSKANPIELSGNDGISRMADSVNAMMLRIEGLIKQQRQLTHDISHELRTPVARMMFRVEGMSIDCLDTQRPHISGMKKDLGNLNHMIDEILTCARLDDNPQPLDKEEFDLLPLVQSMVYDLTIQHPDIAFHNGSNCERLILRADDALLLRAIQNLLNNACRHCQSHILTTIKVTEKYIHICVEDDGSGIPEEERERIFDPFIRLDKSRNRALGGFGLGLPIVQKVTQHHGGHVYVEQSPSLGGASFIIDLPIALLSREQPVYKTDKKADKT
ncbi:ATP-binding protein [Oceanospirillum beijerinckii]|uniref:ATP-binding protein n=1 Tax=Oceanospirillum beijerinckii TaxID=64976 RepID=UPI00047F129C|nr:ATP-binding protein [Oceanospirillum beijerinckii]